MGIFDWIFGSSDSADKRKKRRTKHTRRSTDSTTTDALLYSALDPNVTGYSSSTDSTSIDPSPDYGCADYGTFDGGYDGGCDFGGFD